MKNKLIILMISIILVFLLLIGNIFFHNTLKKEAPKELRKINEQEMNHEIAFEIAEYYLEKNPIEEKIDIKDAKIIANNLYGDYLIRLELENKFEEDYDNLKETIIKYLGNGKWKIELPLKDNGEIDDTNYTEFWPESVNIE